MTSFAHVIRFKGSVSRTTRRTSAEPSEMRLRDDVELGGEFCVSRILTEGR